MKTRILLAAAASLGLAALAACSSSTVHENVPVDSGQQPDSGVGADAGGDAEPACFMNPQTHYELINACTDAQAIDKNPTLPKLLPDGGLPPL